MRSLRLTRAGMLTAALLLTGCGAEGGPTAPDTPPLTADATDHNGGDHTKFVEAVSFEIESPCNGELIAFSGEAVTQGTHLGDEHFLHQELQSHTQATGTGSETGAGYTINDVFHSGFDSPNVPAPHFVASAHATTRVTSDVPGLDFTIHFVFHVLAPSEKPFKVTRDVERVECKG
jgi:hypothetical protein